MEPQPIKRSPGRPAGRRREHKVFTYLDDGELQQLKELALETDRSEAAVLREGLRRMALVRPEDST